MKRTVVALTVFCLSLCGCIQEKPVPPEVKRAEAQALNLWRAGAPLYLPESFPRYQDTFNKAKSDHLRVQSQFTWFRDYAPVQAEFTEVLKEGDALFKQLELEKQKKALSIREQMNGLQETLHHMDQFTRMINGEKVSRSSLAKAEVILNEVRALWEEKQYMASEGKLSEVELHLKDAERVLTPILNRYTDIHQITQWRKWAKETIEESKEKGITALLAIKANRKLLLYKNGDLLKTFQIGLGQNGWLDKQRAKDNATPEGKYRIIGKNPRSRYSKALLINYPNEEDRREFIRAKKKGLLPEATKIGGSIEIHGGGNEGITYGCISLDNRQMEELYLLVGVDTPITIVGAIDDRNSLSSALTVIQNGRTEKKNP